jgi:spore coat protein CotH
MTEFVIEGKLGEMAADISADLSFNWVKITICIDGVNLEV